ncbi:hypothetical protein CEUSTIGMA_g11580.t1 [Chlamydomonas eustigma]|uniref:Glycosyltransferase family 92 protein n=1 Tax=Chlamydomonas eustigma TaxID=1157962 RepID=A0A250XM55_9CHLO|nr:hypothetical protein CEUSTIGMA_g11580.t1 [Chlamydomonas eustigma]|eukprot:GAX84157.1 hypothetical protein CEUSTIGMA_g11580.t1 [Chlamydomonas eustigma]
MLVKVYATLAVLLLCVARLGLAEPPHGELRNGYSAICAVARNEHLYIEEWIEYHLCLGIDKIYLYDHESDIPLERILLRDIPTTVNRVIVQRFKGHHKRFKEGFSSKMERFMKTAQGYAYWHCLQHYSSQHSFIGFIDVDEFLVINDAQALNINSILRDYEPYGGVSFHWRTVGSSGHDRRPNNSVVDSYTACFPEHHEVHRQIKSFVNTRFQPVMHSPHRALFRRKRRKDYGTSASESHAKRRVLTSEAPSIAPLHLQRQNLSLREFLRNSSVRGRLRRKSRILEERRQSSDSEAVGGPDIDSPSLVDEKYRVLKSGLTNVATWDRIAVYHYVTKSREDFEAKVERGGGAGVTRKLEYFDQVNQQTTNICTGAQDSRDRFCRNKGFALL